MVRTPPARCRDAVELVGRLGERDVERRLAGVAAGQQELQADRRLTGARLAVDEVEMPTREPAAEDVIESDHAGQCVGLRLRVLRGFGRNGSLPRKFLRCD